VNALLAILNVFIDPAETVRRIRGNKLAWFPPIALGGLMMAIYNYFLPAFTMMAIRNDPPTGFDTAKLDEMVSTMTFVTRFSTISAPMMFALMTLMSAALIFAACVIFEINIKFPDLYNLMAHVGLINAVQAVAHLIVLKGKPDTLTMKDLMPSFGLGFLLNEDSSKILQGIVNFLSFFTIWHVLVLGIGFAALAGISKGKAFLVTSPSWILGLVFAVIGALFSNR